MDIDESVVYKDFGQRIYTYLSKDCIRPYSLPPIVQVIMGMTRLPGHLMYLVVEVLSSVHMGRTLPRTHLEVAVEGQHNYRQAVEEEEHHKRQKMNLLAEEEVHSSN